MLNLLKKSSNNGYSATQPPARRICGGADLRHRFTPPPKQEDGGVGTNALAKGKSGRPLVGRFTTEEIAQVKMLDLRVIMKDKKVKLCWANNQYEGKCPFHDDPARSPRLRVNQDKGVWLWNCEGGHHGGDTIAFATQWHGNFPKGMEYLRDLIATEGQVKVPGLNGNGKSLREILEPVLEDTRHQTSDDRQKDEIATSADKDRLPRNDDQSLKTQDARLKTVSEDEVVFSFGDMIYHAKDLKNASKNSLKIILKLIYKDGNFTDRVDLHSARARRGFANQAADRLSLQSAQVEEHLESLMESLEEHHTVHDPSSMIHDPREMSPEDREQALALLRDPNLLDRMTSDLDKLGYIGEYTNKKILYLVGTSRLLDRPISAIVRSASGAGKSKLIEYVLEFIPRELWHFFTRITAQSLFYMSPEELDGKIVAVDERDGSHEADYSIRSLQSRNKLSLAASGKDPKTGQWKTHLREFNARTPYMESSTKERINEENLNRCFELYLDEGIEQTRRIQESLRSKASGEGIGPDEEARLKTLYSNAQRLLEARPVKIPQELQIVFANETVRSRRDYEKFLSLIKVIALLHQYQKTPSPLPSPSRGEGVIEATFKDYEIARDLTRLIFGNASSDLSQPLAKFYDALKKKVHEEAKDISIEDYTFTRRDVRRWTGLPDHLVKGQMRQLEDLEYVILKRGGGTTRKIYQVCEQ